MNNSRTALMPHQGTVKRRRSRAAFTLIEFLIASFLTLLVLGAAGLGATSAQQALRTASDVYTGSRVAATVIDTARALGCGEDTDPRFVPASRANCSRELSGTASSNTGDISFQKSQGVVDGRTILSSVEYTTAWQPLNWKPTAAELCNPFTSAKYTGDAATGNLSAWIAPQLLERRVTVTIGKSGATQSTREWRQISAAPERVRAVSSSLDPSKLGALIVIGIPAKSTVEVSASGTTGTVTRAVPSTCGANSSVLFPYLAPGSYSVVITKNGTRAPAVTGTVPAGGVGEIR